MKMKRIRTKTDLAAQMKKVAKKEVEKKKEYDGNTDIMISTGSTLLDLAISGGRVRGGGLPGGILVEVFGPSGSGKTVLLSEIAGAVQRRGGEIMFNDPEARLNKTFAQLFDLDTDSIEYNIPNTVTEVFTAVREWQPKSKQINGVFTDSLAALSTDLEMDNKDGDKMGMRRAKEFSEELRKVCRILTKNNLLMVCSNQIRENADAGMYSEKTTSPGGKAIGFYASVRLRTKNPKKIKETVRVAGKEVQRVIGVEVEFEVYKNSVWKPYRTAPLVILFDYGIDDVRTNLQFVKDHTKNNIYTVKDITLDKSMNVSIRMVEEQNLEKKLRTQVIDLWESIEAMFDSNRKKKER
jgi:recombination protein RecA